MTRALVASVFCLLLSACPGDREPPGQTDEATISLSPASVIEFDQRNVTLQSNASWSRIDGLVLQHAEVGTALSRFTEDIEFIGIDGTEESTHEYLCSEPGEAVALVDMVPPGSRSVAGAGSAVTCLERTADARDDQFYSNSALQPGLVLGYTDIEDSGAAIVELSEETATAINNPGAAPSVPGFTHVLDPMFEGAMAGEYVAVATRVSEPVPTMDPSYDLFYSVVFETDGRAENNWQVQGDFDYDQFQGADRFYQTVWDSSAMGWSIRHTVVGDDQSQTLMPTNAIFTVRGDIVTWLIPRAELGMADLFYRSATFATVNESFAPAESGGDVNGESPTLAMTQILSF